jgi:hypothetical protein
MATRRTVDLLPQIFRTQTNRKFLAATLDQLTQEPEINRTRGYVGRRIGPGVNPADTYVPETDAVRDDYQLEPGVVFLRPDTSQAQDVMTYPGMIDALNVLGADTQRQDRLFQSQYYTWDPFCDLDKFTNYGEYYWLPDGPDAVDVSASDIPYTDDITVSRSADAYTFGGVAGANPVITLARGGTYQFEINQPGSSFWIQSAPGVNGRLPFSPNISSRDVLGVVNNGSSQGTVTFSVPQVTAQDFFYQLPDLGQVDLATDLRFSDINNRYVDQFAAAFPNGIDGITNLDGRTMIFLNRALSASAGGWQVSSFFDPLLRDDQDNGEIGSYDTTLFDQTTDIVNQDQRYSIWRAQYIDGGDGRSYIRLTSVQSVPKLTKVRIGFGTTYSSVSFYRNASGFFERVPLLTATDDVLWYQDGSNPAIFGRIRLVDQAAAEPISIDDIIGAKNYISPNGVVFTNGLKVQFRGPVDPPQFQDTEYYVEGVGSGPGIDFRAGFVDGEAYYGESYVLDGERLAGSPTGGGFQQFVYDTVAESLINQGQGRMSQITPMSMSQPGAAQGNGIRLIPARELVTPEKYTRNLLVPFDSASYDSTPFDEALNSPLTPDYLVINRGSRDRNPWSRTNRWFHRQIIEYSAQLNAAVPVLDNDARAKRPIIEFRADTKLFDFGTQAKMAVNIVDFQTTDALSDINGTTGYAVDGYQFLQGTRVIFAADLDLQVRNRVYRVDFIDPDGDPNSPRIINLVAEPQGLALENQTTVSLNGLTQQGRCFWFDGSTWRLGQQKTSVNQAPLFDVYDQQGRSFGDTRFYPSTSFQGSRLFGYALGGSQISDQVLGFAIKYLNINNIGDIVFQNYFYTDSFSYVQDRTGRDLAVGTGFVRQYIDRTDFSDLIGWLPAAAQNRSRQIFRFERNSGLLILDVPVVTDSVFPPVQIYIDGKYIESDQYEVVIQGNNTFISMLFPVTPDMIIEASVISDEASPVAFYQVPLNLENNALNQNSREFTLGTIRTHYETIGQNLTSIRGPIIGSNNTRDLGQISRYGQNIVQHSAPMTLPGVFLRDPEFEIAQALKFNSQEYEKYKARLINAAGEGDFVNLTATEILDAVLLELSPARDENSPFYWSDMIPAGEEYTETRTVYSAVSIPTFDLRQTYDFSASNFRGLLIYVNGSLLTRGIDYVFGDDVPTVTVTSPLAVGDVVVIREYTSTWGNFVPNTPSKMGLYPAYVPEIYLDRSYVQPRMVIRGHDGSITVAYGDQRDAVLLEFEKRIYNNIKIISPVPLVTADVIPGQWRETDYDLSQINEILSTDFLSWIGWNKIDYTTQDYVNDNPFTYNYSQSQDKISNQPLLGAWRGIYQYLYDTTAPNIRPWEMLGFSQQPNWWEDRYGPAPYTSGNMVLWHDLAQGLIDDPLHPYVDPRYARPDLVTKNLDKVRMISVGTGYVSQPTITITAPPPSRYARPALLGPAEILNGQVVAISIIDPGRGYQESPTILISGGGGSGAVAVADLQTVGQCIPVDSEGQMLPPLEVIAGAYDANSFRRSWVFGDGGPTESAWRSSSSWPFAVMRLLVLTKPAQFFSLFADRDLYVFDDRTQQYLWNQRSRLDAQQMAPLYGDGVSKASYINWIIDYNRQIGVDSTVSLERRLHNLDLRLCWRLGAFSDKRLLKIFTERSTPTSTNASLLLPDESYSLLLYQNPASIAFEYSSVIVQKSPKGYAVLGYSTVTPYFQILSSISNGTTVTISAGNTAVNVPTQHTRNIVRVPYGYVFPNRASVCDFLVSLGEFLRAQGVRFEGKENGYVMDWTQMAQEFLYWSTQGWVDGSMINLNPTATKISITRPGLVAESLAPTRLENIILNQNRRAIAAENLIIDRDGNDLSLEITGAGRETINYFNLRFTAYEHVLVLDNRSIFNDLIYDPRTGARQSRILVSGAISAGWNGTVNAPGFIINQDNIQPWSPNRVYTKGEIVSFKDDLWTASTIIQPGEQFDRTLWLRSDYDLIQQGLLPNAAGSSDELANAYSVFSANLDQEVDLFSYGLIGFRPRKYMSDLDLDDISQVNLYQQFLGTKGTRGALEIFSLADLGKELAEYRVYEYWAIKQALYGANANRSYVEILLDPPRLTSDPSVIQLIEPGQSSQADQAVLIQDLWQSSYKVNSSDVLPVLSKDITDQSLPNAGYVNFDDVNFAVFDLENITNADVDQIGVGSLIWSATVGAYEWGVFRTENISATVTSVTDNLDGSSLVTFDNAHGLTSGDTILIKFFNPDINGSYQVLSTPSLTTITISYRFRGFQTTATGQGLALGLRSARVQQASDTARLSYSTSLRAGDRVWVDRMPQGSWAVLEKTQPFQPSQNLQVQFAQEGSQFGTSMAQGFFNLSALVGAPGYNPADLANAPGAIYSFVRSDQDRYIFNSQLTLDTPDIAGYGNAMEVGFQSWAVVGASASNSDQGYAVMIYRAPGNDAFEQRQLLNAGDGIYSASSFGYSVSISNDERWVYVGAPQASTAGAIYVYARINVEPQSVQYITDGITAVYNYADHVRITDATAWQFTVILANQLLTPGVDYDANDQEVVLMLTPTAGQTLLISRRNSVQFIYDGSTSKFDLGEYFAQVSDIWNFSVKIDGTLQRPGQDYDYDSITGEVEILGSPAAGAIIDIDAPSGFQYVGKILPPALDAGSRFGHSLTTTTDGKTIIVGAPAQDSGSGAAVIVDRATQKFLVTSAGSQSFVTTQPILDPIAVRVNGELLRNTYLNIGGEYTQVSSNIVTVHRDLVVGDMIEIDTNQFTIVQQITQDRVSAGSRFGTKVDQCVNDCSLYVAAPADSTKNPQAGAVELWENQARLYGVIESGIANPVLTAGDYININGFLVRCTGTTITQLVRDINGEPSDPPDPLATPPVPNARASATPDLEFLADGVTRDFVVGSIYSTGAVTSYTTRVLMDGQLLISGVDYQYLEPPLVAQPTIRFTQIPVQNSQIKVVSGRITISVINLDAAPVLDRLRVQPGTGTLWSDLGFSTYMAQQSIYSPVPQDYAGFGEGLWISDDTVTLSVGAPGASSILDTTFDRGSTRFDASSTTFVSIAQQSGAVYVFDFLPASQASASNPGQFVFGQQLAPKSIQPFDRFGTAIDFTTGVMLLGAPSNDLGDSQLDFGTVFQYTNPTNEPSWKIVRQQQPSVDVNLLNTVYLYDANNQYATDYIDYFDPLQGRLLGAVAQNLDYIGAIDPASYNVGPVNNRGSRWAQEYVGQIWWDTSRVRFIDPNQGDLTYASNRWGQVFPGSQIDVYQWTVSTVPPASYTGPGTVRSIDSYVLLPTLDQQGLFRDVYYFWVQESNEIADNKTLSTQTLAGYIENPRGSGIPYLASLSASAVALYNCRDQITRGNSVLHLQFDQVANDAPVHAQYHLVPQGRDTGFLTDILYQKFLDSLSGTNVLGAAVPDPFLPPSEQYGVNTRPRQSMFRDRLGALENYLTTANLIIAQFPITETRSLRTLNSADPVPSSASGQWNMRLADDRELSYQNLAEVPLGYRYLVDSDARNDGLWAIYQVTASALPGVRQLQLVRVQNYDTRRYWQRTDWYRLGYDPLTKVVLEVPVSASLETVSVAPGSSVRVQANAQGLWEIYQWNGVTWDRVALQNGTVQFSAGLWDYNQGRFGFDQEVFDSQYFDQAPFTETRRVIEAINQDLLIDELLIERNRLLILMFQYILSEQLNPDWLTKTSLVDVQHVIRELQPFQIYRKDNQDFVLQYINEVKPYHTQIREFDLIYRGQDRYLGTLTDFDLPARWDPVQSLFVSPVLDDTGSLSTTSSTPADSPIWQQFPWDQWFQNYLLEIQQVVIRDGGSGYQAPPEVRVIGQAQRPAQMIARINSAGRVVAVEVQDPGQGYETTAVIELVGGLVQGQPWQPESTLLAGAVIETSARDVYSVVSSGITSLVPPTSRDPAPAEITNGTVILNYLGTRALAVASMGNPLVRSITATLKYDRFQYRSSILPWVANQIYVPGDRVRYVDRAWQAAGTQPFASADFDPDQWMVVPAAELSGVDRTMAYYAPTPDQPGIDLAQLISGVAYPGVQVAAPGFDLDTGFGLGLYDATPFDNISFGPEGVPTYDPAILDAIYESEFTDPYLGVLPAPAYAGDPPTTGPNPIVIDGGGFVDTYSSHAPEELIPGAVFDTLDLRVYTTPGADWLGQGHGFPITSKRYQFDPAQPVIDFQNLLDLAVSITVFNVTTGVLLYPTLNYSVSWADNTVTMLNGVSDGDIISISLASLGGGNQIFAQRVTGATTQPEYVIPRAFDSITQIVIYVNGARTTAFSADAVENGTSIVFDPPLSDQDAVVITVFGGSAQQSEFSWSVPVTQSIITTGSLNYALSNDLQGTNAVDLIVSVNGRRARPYNNRFLIADGINAQFAIPETSDAPPNTIANNDVAVYVDNMALTLGTEFVLDPSDGSSTRTVTLAQVPPAGSSVLISVRTQAQYRVVGNTLTLLPVTGLNPPVGSIITVTTFNDTRQQGILTKVYVGPRTQGLRISEPYDTTLFDQGNDTGEPGSYDYSVGTFIEINRFDSGRLITDTNRLLVTLDGRFLFHNIDYVTDGADIVILGSAINPNSVVAITSFTDRVVPQATAFRIFQDMRGTQSLYRIVSSNTTVLAQPLAATADVAFVQDASKLDQPDLSDGIFGIVTINGERLTYRVRDLANNSIAGLRRGTAGTAAAAHLAGSSVTSLGTGDLLPGQYQRQTIQQQFLANGVDTTFVATDIDLQQIDSTELVEAVQVFEGGVLRTSGYTVLSSDPVTIEFDTAPPAGVEITVSIQQARVMYAQGTNTASDGVPLQESSTPAARFILGR